MPKFIVSVREVHVQPYEVEAQDKEAAIKVVRDGGGDIDDGAFEYSHTLDPEFWTVEEVPVDLDEQEQVDNYERQLKAARLVLNNPGSGKLWKAYEVWCEGLELDPADADNEARFKELEKKIKEGAS